MLIASKSLRVVDDALKTLIEDETTDITIKSSTYIKVDSYKREKSHISKG